MKPFRFILSYGPALLLAGLFFSACEQAADDTFADSTPTPQALQVESDHPTSIADDPLVGFAQAIEGHVEAHGVLLEEAEERTFQYPDGTSADLFVVDGDVAMTKAALQDLAAAIAAGEKQYRTNNLVSPQTITVIGYTGGSYALTSKMRTALSWAVANYNALPLNLTFSLSFSASTNADIVVYRNASNSGAGGVAGFPSGGQPYKWVEIYAGTNSYDTNVVEHVMTHEIGHCLGLRHADWSSRASCGQNSNEGSAGVGAVHIPGTPTGIDWNSVMLACFSSSEDGEFGYYDRVALEYLY